MRKGVPLGKTRVLILCIELFFVWLAYYGLGLATSYEIPLGLAAVLVVITDRFIGFVSARLGAIHTPSE